MRIILTQVGAMGDCLLSTIIARQIKEVDYPGSHLTWVVGDRFKEVVENNPHVDEIIVLPVGKERDAFMSLRYSVRAYVDELVREGRVFDKIIILDLDEKNAPYLWGTCRSIYFRLYHEIYGQKVTVSPEPVIRLKEGEVKKVRDFCREHGLADAYPILIEYSPNSGQSMMNKQLAVELANKLIEKYPHVKCVLTSHERIATESAQIIDGSVLSYRENAELLNHCKLLIGANSGITWLNASTWAKKIPMIQSVVSDFSDNSTELSFSVEMDCKYVGDSTENLIELRSPAFEELYKCVCEVVDSSFDEVKSKHKEIETPASEYMYRFYQRKHKSNLNSAARCESDGQKTSVFPAFAKLKVSLFNFFPLATMRQKRHQIDIKILGIPFLKIKGK